MKKIIFLALALLLITGCGSKEEVTDNSKLNNNDNITKEQTVNDLTMNNVSLNYKDGITTFKVDITNKSNKELNITKFDITFKTESDEVITVLNGGLDSTIGPDETIDMSITSDVDLSDAFKVEYNIEQSEKVD